MWVAPQKVPAAPVRRTLESEQLPDGGGSGFPEMKRLRNPQGRESGWFLSVSPS